jgi:two-component system nitrate/nitrite sensor histidine kinase NarX
VVSLALVFFFLGEVLMLTNYTTDRAYDYIVCPIGNTFHILAIPLLGYVYLREQSIEKRRAERALKAYRDHLEDLVRERTTELGHLHRASTVLASALDADEIYEQIVQQSVELLNCRAACILTRSQNEQPIRLLACCGMDEPHRAIARAQPGATVLLDDLWAQRQTIAIADAAADPRVPETWIGTMGVKAILCLPIKSTQDPLGFLFLMDLEASRAWRTEEIELVESFVNHAAIALVNANLHKQLEWAAALEERQRIAADMHDGLGQTLSLLGLRVDQASEHVVTGSSHASIQELQHIRELIEQASYDVRRSIASLQETPRPRRSLQDQLVELVEQPASKLSPLVHLTADLQDRLFLPPEHEEQILPIVQEALLNALYHAQATRIDLRLGCQADQVTISVQDDGRGFDPEAVQNNGGGHFGLSIMRARAARIGADLSVSSQPGHGTRVTLTWSRTEQTAQSFVMLDQPRPAVQTQLELEAER